MKNQIAFVCALAALGSLALLSDAARGDTLAHWTFNSPGQNGGDNDPTTGTLSPESGAGTVSLVGGVTQSASGFAQGSNNDTSPTVGSNNNSSWDTQGYPPDGSGSKTAGLQIAVNTTGFQDIGLSYEHSQAAGASARFRIQYSSDGVNYTDVANFYETSAASQFILRGEDFSAVAALDNNPNVRFRVVAELNASNQYIAVGGGSYNQNARNRFDLVTVTGTPIPEPAALATAGMIALSGLALRRRAR